MFTGGNVTEFEQNGNMFYIRPIEPFTSLKLIGDLQKMISPVVGSVISAFADTTFSGEDGKESDSNEPEAKKSGFLDNDVDMAAVESVFTALAQHVDGQKLEQMCRRILDKQYVSVAIGGAKPVRLEQSQINELFTGRVSDMLRLIIEVLKVNYSDFTDLFKSPFGNARELLKSLT